MNGCFSNDTPLRQLLSSWKCLVLAVHIEEEGIDIEELEMMKTEHMTELLRNYRLGIRIRFEHYFEKWRLNINKPVVNMGSNYMNAASFRPTFNELQYSNENNNNKVINNESVSIGVNTDPTELNTIPIIPPPPLVALPPPIITLKPVVNESFEIHQPKDVPQTPQPSHFNVEIKNKKLCISRRLSVLNILKSSGRKGLDILASYKEKSILTQDERTTLINVISHYFLENNQHISLKTSYELERQILKLFPTEKLKYYRTSRRGKIYIRYHNSKGYKREKRKCMKSKATKSSILANIKKSSTIRGDTTELSEPTLLEGFEIKTENDEIDVEIDE